MKAMGATSPRLKAIIEANWGDGKIGVINQSKRCSRQSVSVLPS
jgi:hypothetical protein